MRWKSHVRFGRRAEEADRQNADRALRSDLTSGTRSWMSVGVGCGTRCSAIVAAETTRCIGRAGSFTKGRERLDEKGNGKLVGFLDASDSTGIVPSDLRRRPHPRPAVRAARRVVRQRTSFAAQSVREGRERRCVNAVT